MNSTQAIKAQAGNRIAGTIESTADVTAPVAAVWEQVVNVDIQSAPHPGYFRLVGIPTPLRAEIVSTGVGGERVAYFATGKRFLQRITTWRPPNEYAFTFNPEQGFKVLFFFDLSDGLVQIPAGSYLLTDRGIATTIQLKTEYSIDRRVAFLFELPVRICLRGFQRFLLSAISKNVADANEHTLTT